jgi:hypothetical protein
MRDIGFRKSMPLYPELPDLDSPEQADRYLERLAGGGRGDRMDHLS